MTPSQSIELAKVTYTRSSDDRLWLRYQVEMPVDRLALPAPVKTRRADKLWETTCCEAFVRSPRAKGYVEYNISPSSQWAAYRFDDYRKGMTELPMEMPPKVSLNISENCFALDVEYLLPGEWRGDLLELALSAVIQERDGNKSYWALAHPLKKPDFHHGDCFALQLAAPSLV